MGLLSRLFKQPKPPGRNVVVFNGDKIVRTLPDGRVESVRWDDLQKVEIMTTDEGPFAEDVYWMLKGVTGGCAIPSQAQGMKELLSRLQQLPGFKNEAVIKATASADNATFLCWSRGNAL